MTGIEFKAALVILLAMLGITAPLPDALGSLIVGMCTC